MVMPWPADEVAGSHKVVVRRPQGGSLDEPGQMLDFTEERTGSAIHSRPKRRR